MIRKAIIVLLMLAAVGTGVVWALSRRDILWFTVIDSDEWLVEGATFHGRVACASYKPQRTLAAGHPDLSIATPLPLFHVDSPPTYSTQGFEIWFPMWFPFILFAVYPAIAFIRGPVRRWRRRKRGECVRCGYNLTGNVSGVCPECGTPT